MEDRKPKDQIVICCGNCIYLRKCFGDTYCTNPEGLVGTITEFDSCEYFTERKTNLVNNKIREEKENRKELIKALKVIKQTCKRITGIDCTWTSGEGNCPICEILENCPVDYVPADWTFKEGIEEHE